MGPWQSVPANPAAGGAEPQDREDPPIGVAWWGNAKGG